MYACKTYELPSEKKYHPHHTRHHHHDLKIVDLFTEFLKENCPVPFRYFFLHFYCPIFQLYSLKLFRWRFSEKKYICHLQLCLIDYFKTMKHLKCIGYKKASLFSREFSVRGHFKQINSQVFQSC